MSRILASRLAPLLRLRIPTEHSCTEAKACLRSPSLNNLQELEFCYAPDYGPPPTTRLWTAPILPLPPTSTFCFAATLRLANIGKCRLTDSIVQGLHFPKLKHLALHWVNSSECSIQRLIAGCPALECLLICYISGLDCLRINALKRRIIGVRTYFHNYWKVEPWLDKLVIENAPCLERLLRLDLLDATQVSVIAGPKLEGLGSVTIKDEYPSFSMLIECLRVDGLTTGARLVKILAVHKPFLDLDRVIDLMICFPCLEKLYIQDEFMHIPRSSPKNLWRRKHKKLIGCLDIHLKTIALETYEGIVSDVNFVTFFVLNTKELELMTIQVETIDEKFIARHQRLLQLEKKASRGARFQFTTDRCLRDFSDIYNVCALDLPDPFLRRF